MAERGDKPGLSAALDRSGAGSPPAAKAEQLSFDALLEPQVRSNASRTAAAEIRERRGPGRPAGSPNKRTQEWIDYLDARYTSTLEGLRAVGAMHPKELLISLEIVQDADELAGMPKHERRDWLKWAFERIQFAQDKATPYTHAKLGQVAIDDEGSDVPLFVMGLLERPGGGQPGDRARRVGGSVIDMRPQQERTQGNQQVSKGDGEASNAEASNETAKPLSDNGESDA